VETVENEGVWLGMVPDTRGLAVDSEIPLAPGDLALFFTDGMTEAMDADGQMFGQERLAAALAKGATRPLAELKAALVKEVKDFAHAQEDDLTLVLVRRVA
jgi:sigma-B regulation protein RsbU (phosphoserine phosphatase)